jgi:hypothetical protein
MARLALSLLLAAALAGCAYSAIVAQVHDYINNQECKQAYIRPNRPACVAKGQCFPAGTDAKHQCTTITHWQWQDTRNPSGVNNYAPGVNPYPIHRITATGDDAQKVVWAYTGSIHQGEAYQVYRPDGQVTVDMLLNTPVNHITFIANVNVEQPSHWFSPGKNNTDGCGQLQTWELPFGFQGNATETLPVFQQNLQRLHSSGITITLTMGSWCTQFPVAPEEEWTPDMFQQFVAYFEQIRTETFGGSLDGIDFDWEGFCKQECLKGACTCDWNDTFCGEFSPEELAEGQTWYVPQPDGTQVKKMCWILPTKSTMQVLTGMTYWMKKAGYVVTLVPMSTAMYTGEPDTTPNQVMRNELVKWRNQPYPGGQAIDGSTQVDLMDQIDGVLLQWYSGFDAALCRHSPDAKVCACNNVPDADYPNVINITNGMISSYYYDAGAGGNMFPTTFPVRCQACGDNVLLPNGTFGNLPCAPSGEDWYKPGDGTKDPSITQSHIAGAQNYTATHNGSIPYWWVQGMTVNSKCPRSIDCPDWRYEGETNYSRQLALLESLGNVVDLNKVAIGFETLGIDVQVQYQAYADPTLLWPPVTQQQIDSGLYYLPCTQNMTKDNIAQEMRCGQPLLAQQWGLKFNADDVIGLSKAVLQRTGKTLAGIGMFTLDGVLWVPPENTTRFWYPQMMKLNETYQIPCHGDHCGYTPPAPSGGNNCNPSSCNVCPTCCKSYLKDQTDCDACVQSSCAPKNVCNPGSCNVCSTCCQSYLKSQTDCDSCVQSSCSPKKTLKLSKDAVASGKLL